MRKSSCRWEGVVEEVQQEQGVEAGRAGSNWRGGVLLKVTEARSGAQKLRSARSMAQKLRPARSADF